MAAARAAVPGLRRLGVLATDGTLRAGTYAGSAAADLELVVPTAEVQDEVMSIIYDGVKAGVPVPRARFDAVVDHLRARGAEVVALGCTELSVVYHAQGWSERADIVDSVETLARATVLRAGRTPRR